ncbi:hypothetical protein AB6813_02135 [bacterium RCC_150]
MATFIPWLLGVYAVFFISAQYTGLELLDSYLAFQGGSNLGNLIWFSLWSGASSMVCLFLVRRIRTVPNMRCAPHYILLAYAVPAMLLVFPDTSMGFAVSHVREFPDGMAPYSALALLLIESGTVAFAAGIILAVVNYARLHRREN